jgi:hypothetical protein
MALNIGKYQLPYLEYNLFRDYIAENLCVKRNEADNDCRGNCHLGKQLRRISETDENSPGNPGGEKQVKWLTDDYVAEDRTLSVADSSATQLATRLIDVPIPEISRDIPVPPPKRCVPCIVFAGK